MVPSIGLAAPWGCRHKAMVVVALNQFAGPPHGDVFGCTKRLAPVAAPFLDVNTPNAALAHHGDDRGSRPLQKSHSRF